MRKILARGAHSDVYVDTDDVHGAVIIKESRYQSGGKNDVDYISNQLRGYDVVDEIRKSGADFGVVLPELIKVIDGPEYRAIVEKRINGVDFKWDVYANLSLDQKENAAHQIALFLNAMHQMRTPKPADKPIKNLFARQAGSLSTTQQFSDVFEGHISPAYLERIRAAERALDGYDISDEVHVMTHRDLRNQNIMYDRDSGRVAVIDFELAGQDNIYRDFVPFAASTAMPWDFWRRVIKYYNAIENKKYPISINPEKVKNALIYGAAHEFSRVLNHQKQEGKDINIVERAELLRRRLDYLIGIDELFDSGAVTKKTDAWGRAAIKVAKKDNHITAAMRAKNMHDKGAGY